MAYTYETRQPILTSIATEVFQHLIEDEHLDTRLSIAYDKRALGWCSEQTFVATYNRIYQPTENNVISHEDMASETRALLWYLCSRGYVQYLALAPIGHRVVWYDIPTTATVKHRDGTRETRQETTHPLVYVYRHLSNLLNASRQETPVHLFEEAGDGALYSIFDVKTLTQHVDTTGFNSANVNSDRMIQAIENSKYSNELYEYISYKTFGDSDADIAVKMGVSFNHIRTIKASVIAEYKALYQPAIPAPAIPAPAIPAPALAVVPAGYSDGHGCPSYEYGMLFFNHRMTTESNERTERNIKDYHKDRQRTATYVSQYNKELAKNVEDRRNKATYNGCVWGFLPAPAPAPAPAPFWDF